MIDTIYLILLLKLGQGLKNLNIFTFFFNNSYLKGWIPRSTIHFQTCIQYYRLGSEV